MYLLPLKRDYVDTVKIPIFDAYYDSTSPGVCVCDVSWYEDHSQSKISFTLRPRTLAYTLKLKTLNISIQLIYRRCWRRRRRRQYRMRLFNENICTTLHWTLSSRQQFCLRYPDSSSPGDYCQHESTSSFGAATLGRSLFFSTDRTELYFYFIKHHTSPLHF